jgi:hypothetical protein
MTLAQERSWTDLSEYVDAVLTCPDASHQMHLDPADFEPVEPHDLLASVAIMCARRVWGEPDAWSLYDITKAQWQDFVAKFRCTGWDVHAASSGNLSVCVAFSQKVPGLFLWQDADIPLGINIKKIDVPTRKAGPLFLWCVPSSPAV